MTINTSQKIINYINKKRQATGSELAEYLNITDRAVRKQLKNLLETDIIIKIGKPPKVFYLIKEINKNKKILINNNFKREI